MNQEEINAKARELVESFMPYVNNYSTFSKPNEKLKVVFEQGQRVGRAKQCALIDIQNTIDMLRGLDPYINLSCYNQYLDEIVKHQLIKQAIENL